MGLTSSNVMNSAARTPLGQRINRIGPYASLALVLIPLTIVEPLKLVAVYFAGKGHWIGGTLALVVAYGASLLIVDRLFRLLKPNILKAPILKRAWEWFIETRHACGVWLFHDGQLIRMLARAGYAARATVFLILAYFTAIAATEAGTRPVDTKDALESMLTRPLGNALLVAITSGLICFALWREAQAR